MGIKDWLGLGDAISKPIETVGKLYTTDKDRIAAETQYQETIQKPVLAQISTNAVMAAAQSIFISGWQPLIGWTAGFILLIYYVPQILIISYVWGQNCLELGIITNFPMKSDDLLNLVWLLFGFGGYSLLKSR